MLKNSDELKINWLLKELSFFSLPECASLSLSFQICLLLAFTPSHSFFSVIFIFSLKSQGKYLLVLRNGSQPLSYRCVLRTEEQFSVPPTLKHVMFWWTHQLISIHPRAKPDVWETQYHTVEWVRGLKLKKRCTHHPDIIMWYAT